MHVYQFYSTLGSNTWVNVDLTASAGGPLDWFCDGFQITSFADRGMQSVFYVASDANPHMLFSGSGTWSDTYLSGGLPIFPAGTPLTSFPFCIQ